MSASPRRTALLAVAAVGVLAAAVAYSLGEGDEGDDDVPRVRIMAAASLSRLFVDATTAYQRAHPDLALTVEVAGSGQLVTTVVEGGSADVVATADRESMELLARAGRLTGPARVLARNRLALAVPAGNPKSIRGLADLARPGVVVAVGAPQVPVGRYGREALARAVVSLRPATEEASVSGVLAKVALGEVDAGIVYATDTHDGVETVPLPPPEQVDVTAYVAVVSGADAAAHRFVRFLLGPDGRQTAAGLGFVPP